MHIRPSPGLPLEKLTTTILLLPAYRQRLTQEAPTLRSVQRWSAHSESRRQDCFDQVDWDMFHIASNNNIDKYADSVSEFISKCTGVVVPTATIKTFPSQKPWIDGNIHAKLKARTTAFNQGKVTGNMTEYKQCSYSLRKAIKQAKRQYRDKVVAIQRLRHKRYVAGSTVNHGLQKENQPRCGPGCLAPRQTKQLLCSL